MPPAATPDGARPVGWPLLLVLAALAAVSPVATDLYLPGFPQLGGDLSASASQVQLTLTAFLVGMGVGQLVTGPLSDRFGRRRPLLVTTLLCVGAGVVAATAPSLEVLVSARLFQGVTGAGGIVIGRAVIADLATGRTAAKAFTLMLTVGGVAPVASPFVGSLLLAPLGWRGLLWVVAGLTLLLVPAVLRIVPETLPPDQRSRAGAYLDGVREVARTRAYWPPVVVFAFAFGVLMSYIAASPFVYQNVVGLSAIGYGLAFAANATGMIAAGWVSSRMVDRVRPRTLVRAGILVQVVALATLVALVLAGAPTWTFPVAILVAVTMNGLIMGNAASLAMGHVRAVAGTGSAVLGGVQFAVGAVVSPLTGLGGAESALVPALVMLGCALPALVVSRVGLR